MAINTRVPEDMEFGKRGVTARDVFVATQEAGQDRLSGEWSQDINQMAVEFNETAVTVNELEQSSQESADSAFQSKNEAEMYADMAKSSVNYLGDWEANYDGGNGYSVGSSVSYSDNRYLSKVDGNLSEPTLETSDANWYFTSRKSLVYSTKTANYTMQKLDYINVDSSGGSFTLTLPSAHSLDDEIYVNSGANAEENSVTVDGNGSNILFQNEVDTTLVLDKNGIELKFKSNGTDWRVL